MRVSRGTSGGRTGELGFHVETPNLRKFVLGVPGVSRENVIYGMIIWVKFSRGTVFLVRTPNEPCRIDVSRETSNRVFTWKCLGKAVFT